MSGGFSVTLGGDEARRSAGRTATVVVTGSSPPRRRWRSNVQPGGDGENGCRDRHAVVADVAVGVCYSLQHDLPLPVGEGGVGGSREPCLRQRVSVLAVTVDPGVLEADLEAGRLCCPGCGGPLRAWGHARERKLRMLDGERVLRPRRACCHACETTHVLLAAWSVPRRRDGAEVIGEALLAKAHGAGHRVIAARLGRPPGTVRGWLRAFARRAEAISVCARRWAYAIDATITPGTPVFGSPLADAVDALAITARACRLRLGMRGSPWELSVALTGGLLHGRVRDPGL